MRAPIVALLLHQLRHLQDVPQPFVLDDSALVDLRQLIENAVRQGSAFRSHLDPAVRVVIDLYVCLLYTSPSPRDS